MGQPNIFVENYNIVHDTVCKTFLDSARIANDSVASFNAFLQAHDFYETSFNKINGILSWATTWFTVVLGVMTLIVGVKFVWDIWAAAKVFSRILRCSKKELNKRIENFFEENAYIYYNFGNNIAVSSKGAYGVESMKNFLLALNSLCLMPFSNKNYFLYQYVLRGVSKTWSLDLSCGENIFYKPLCRLKEILSKEKDANSLVLDIETLLNELNMDYVEDDEEIITEESFDEN